MHRIDIRYHSLRRGSSFHNNFVPTSTNCDSSLQLQHCSAEYSETRLPKADSTNQSTAAISKATMSLPTAQLGRNGPQVNRLGFGLMGLSMFYGAPKPDEERLQVLTEAYNLGERFWDTSDL